MQTAKQLIGGRWLTTVVAYERLGEALKPASGDVAALFAEGSAAKAQAAVAAALQAFEHTAWKRSPRLRAEVLLEFAKRPDARSGAKKTRRIADRLRSGTVWSNSHNRRFAEAQTGGLHDSGSGRLHGAEGRNDFLQTKHFYFETNP